MDDTWCQAILLSFDSSCVEMTFNVGGGEMFRRSAAVTLERVILR